MPSSAWQDRLDLTKSYVFALRAPHRYCSFVLAPSSTKRLIYNRLRSVCARASCDSLYLADFVGGGAGGSIWACRPLHLQWVAIPFVPLKATMTARTESFALRHTSALALDDRNS